MGEPNEERYKEILRRAGWPEDLIEGSAKRGSIQKEAEIVEAARGSKAPERVAVRGSASPSEDLPIQHNAPPEWLYGKKELNPSPVDLMPAKGAGAAPPVPLHGTVGPAGEEISPREQLRIDEGLGIFRKTLTAVDAVRKRVSAAERQKAATFGYGATFKSPYPEFLFEDMPDPEQYAERLRKYHPGIADEEVENEIQKYGQHFDKVFGLTQRIEAEERLRMRNNSMTDIGAAEEGAAIDAEAAPYLQSTRESLFDLRSSFDVAKKKADRELNYRLAALDAGIKELRGKKINPMQYWEEDPARRLWAGLAIGFHNLAGMTGGNNAALQMIMQDVENNIEAQKANIGTQFDALNAERNVLQFFYDKMQDMPMAEHAARKFFLDDVILQAQEMAAKRGDVDNLAATEKMVNDLTRRTKQEELAMRLRAKQIAEQMRLEMQQRAAAAAAEQQRLKDEIALKEGQTFTMALTEKDADDLIKLPPELQEALGGTHALMAQGSAADVRDALDLYAQAEQHIDQLLSLSSNNAPMTRDRAIAAQQTGMLIAPVVAALQRKPSSALAPSEKENLIPKINDLQKTDFSDFHATALLQDLKQTFQQYRRNLVERNVDLVGNKVAATFDQTTNSIIRNAFVIDPKNVGRSMKQGKNAGGDDLRRAVVVKQSQVSKPGAENLNTERPVE